MATHSCRISSELTIKHCALFCLFEFKNFRKLSAHDVQGTFQLFFPELSCLLTLPVALLTFHNWGHCKQFIPCSLVSSVHLTPIQDLSKQLDEVTQNSEIVEIRQKEAECELEAARDRVQQQATEILLKASKPSLRHFTFTPCAILDSSAYLTPIQHCHSVGF